jgi:CspA family cold shock protein
MQGKVKNFNKEKGFGFIRVEAEGAEPIDFFFHWSDIVAEGYKALNQGDAVEFTPVDSEKGKKASQVKLKK